ncbi:GGDEF domain-containing protein [Paraglaciecola sp. L3A3]|uniref:GGDEF domain-containing protein n=1 Tax=Paraglaciecola sp. L3A3 TaxID=2686358 RepID=UPI00131B0CA8|nr:GGDEF domain-containing protein [Paraglaciecola sp. L3A3]
MIDPSCQQMSLRGLWQALPGKIIPPAQITQFQQDAITLEIPSYWPENKVKVDEYYPRGLITLWAEIELNGIYSTGEDLAFWPGRQSSTMRVYIDNGHGTWVKAFDNLSPFIAESDEVIKSLPPAGSAGLLHSGASFQLPKLYPGNKVILQLYIDDYRTGGIAQPPQIGQKDELYRNIMHRSSWHILFLGASLLVTIFAAAQAIFSSSRRALHLFLVLISLGTGLRLLVTGSVLAYLFPHFTINHYFYLAWGSFLSLLAIFVGAQVYLLPAIFKQHFILKKLLLFLSAIPIVLLLFIPLLTLHEFLLIGHSLRTFYVLVAFSYALFLSWKVYARFREHWLQLLGLVIILVSGAYDAFLYAQNIDPYLELFAIAIFLFITSQAIYFGWEHMRLLGREQRLAQNLKELNESLEKQVLTRTQDLQTANTRLTLAATTDVLTQLPNRRAFDSAIKNEINQTQSHNENLCLAIVDADWFKSVNDQYGHDFGDQVLQILAMYLSERLRVTDFIARIGGEEFAIILPATDIAHAKILLEQLCKGVAQLQLEEAKDYQLSVSIGGAEWHEGLSINELYRLADKALYKAKHNGRGRVEVSQ